MRTIPDYPGYFADSEGAIWTTKQNQHRRLAQFEIKDGYLGCKMICSTGRAVQAKVHQIICSAFHGRRPDGTVTRHLNGNPKDNRPENLTWGTMAQNYDDRRRHGTDFDGDRNPFRKLASPQVTAIRVLYAAGLSCVDLARHFSVSLHCISTAVRGRTYKDAGGPVTEWHRNIGDRNGRRRKRVEN